MIDGEVTFLTGDLQPRDGETIHAQIERSGAPGLLLERYAGRLEPHSPWHVDREVSHLFRGTIDVREANELLAAQGHGGLRLVDNGEIEGELHAYHLIPAGASKAARGRRSHARARLRARGVRRCGRLAGGPGGGAQVVGRFFLVANADVTDASGFPGVERTEAAMSEGFYEAVIRALTESR